LPAYLQIIAKHMEALEMSFCIPPIRIPAFPIFSPVDPTTRYQSRIKYDQLATGQESFHERSKKFYKYPAHHLIVCLLLNILQAYTHCVTLGYNNSQCL